MAFLRALLRDRKGATAIEYTVLIVVVALGLIAALTSMGGTVNGWMEEARDGFTASG